MTLTVFLAGFFNERNTCNFHGIFFFFSYISFSFHQTQAKTKQVNSLTKIKNKKIKLELIHHPKKWKTCHYKCVTFTELQERPHAEWSYVLKLRVGKTYMARCSSVNQRCALHTTNTRHTATRTFNTKLISIFSLYEQKFFALIFAVNIYFF